MPWLDPGTYKVDTFSICMFFILLGHDFFSFTVIGVILVENRMAKTTLIVPAFGVSYKLRSAYLVESVTYTKSYREV